MADLLIFLLLLWGVYHLIKIMTKAYLDYSRQEPREKGSDTELIRDPQCGVYFMKQKGVRGVVDGRELYFCSKQCYERYLKSRSAK